MRIVIGNYMAGSFLLEKEPGTWDAIVILDSGLTPSDFVAKHAREHLYLRFDDVKTPSRGRRLPADEDVRAALAFAAGSENLLVCCRAGQSRSAALAFVIAYQQLGSEKASDLLNPERHLPNPLIIELGAKVIDDPLLFQAFHQWQVANAGHRSLDYWEQLERELDALERQGARNRIVSSTPVSETEEPS